MSTTPSPRVIHAISASSGLLPTIRVKFQHSFRLYRSWWREISLGAYVRILTLLGILIAAFTIPLFPDLNDMNELITLGIVNMFQGLNPYGRTYELSALGATPSDGYSQDFLNYGPMSLLFHLPCMVYPWMINGVGFLNLQPSFMIYHAFFDFLIFDRLMRMNQRFVALFVWLNPLFVVIDMVTPMSIPIFLVVMGYEKWKDPLQSVFWLGLGALTYQYLALLLLFAMAYHIRSSKGVILGLLPSLAILGAFQLWAMFEGRPLALVTDLLVQQFGRAYEPWFPNHQYSWYTWTGSIPAIVFNVLGQDPLLVWTGGLLRLSTFMTATSLSLAILFLVHTILRPDYKRSILYSSLSLLLVLLSSPVGLWHHNVIVAFPLYMIFVEWESLQLRGLRGRLRS
ncbi:MAG: hypothetical protein ACFFCO_09605 [Promethearchaeota archaeon]